MSSSERFEISKNSNADITSCVDKIYYYYFDEIVRQSNLNDTNNLNRQALLNISVNNEFVSPSTEGDIWIFGYGSLMWKADFPYVDRRPGFICGYKRRFFQHSLDHRGTPTKPGRVVTILPTGLNNDRVYGVAYRIAASKKQDVLEHLDYREKNGYERRTVEFQLFPEDANQKFSIIMYIASEQNDSFAGNVWQIPLIAEQIFTSAGPSGPNRDYLFNLANTMRELFPGVHDEHLFDLELEVLKRILKDEINMLEKALKREIRERIESYIKDGCKSEIVVAEFMSQIEPVINLCHSPGWKEQFLQKEIMNTKNEYDKM